jgi:hypothetical protein
MARHHPSKSPWPLPSFSPRLSHRWFLRPNSLPFQQKPSFHRCQWVEDGFFVLFLKKCPFQLRRKVRCDPSFLYSHASPHIIWPGLGRSIGGGEDPQGPRNPPSASKSPCCRVDSGSCLRLDPLFISVLFTGSSRAKSFFSVHEFLHLTQLVLFYPAKLPPISPNCIVEQ